MGKKKPEFKNLSFEIKDAEAGGVITGYAAAFGNTDLVDDIIEKGAFKKTIQETGGVWPILKDHDPRNKIGYNLEAEENDRGLFVKEQISLDTQMGKESFALSKLALKVGGKDGLSIGFIPIKAEPNRDKPHIRMIKEVKLLEHSHVTFAANENAFAVAAKHWQINSGDDLGLDQYTDLFFKHMESIGFNHKDVIEALGSYRAAQKTQNNEEINSSIDRAIKILTA